MATVQRIAPDVEVYVGGTLSPNFHAISCELGSDADSLPKAILEVETIARKSGRLKLENIDLADFDQKEVEIVVPVAGNKHVVHWGKILAHQASLSDGGDSIKLESRMSEHHFGLPLRQTHFWHHGLRRVLALDLPTVFNPELDGVIKPNQATRVDSRRRHFFAHEECFLSATATTHNLGNAPDYWILPTAVNYLCKWLNDETYVENPTLAELFATLPHDQDLLRNHEQPFGAWLPEQLDAILKPFGFGWTVDCIARGRRVIRIFKRGAGLPRSLKLQPVGQELNMDASQLESQALTADVDAGAFNGITVVGDFKRYESTFVLQRGWSDAYDAQDEADLEKNCAAWDVTPDLQDVWRKWVLNEANDYTGLRPGITAAHNFNLLFGARQYIARRRKFLPCLSLNLDGTPRGHAGGVFIEWWDNDQLDWRPLDELDSAGRQVRILDKECGIYFDGQNVPTEILQQGAYAAVRVTASVDSDRRVLIGIDDWPNSQLHDYRPEYLTCRGKFKFRKKDATSRFAGVGLSDAVDDTPKISVLARELLTRWNAATISGNVTLTGVDHDYQEIIGQTVPGIPGRKVGFSVVAGGRRYPTIVAIKIRFDTQQLDLQLDTFRGERTI